MIAFSSSKPRTKVAVYLCAALFIALNSSPTNGRIEKNSAQRNNSRLLQAVNTHGAKKLLPDELSAVLLNSTIYYAVLPLGFRHHFIGNNKVITSITGGVVPVTYSNNPYEVDKDGELCIYSVGTEEYRDCFTIFIDTNRQYFIQHKKFLNYIDWHIQLP